MRLKRFALAVALFVLLANVIASPAAAIGSGSIASPGPGSTLERNDTVTLNYSRSIIPNNSTSVNGTISLDGIAIGSYTRGLSSNVTNDTFSVSVNVPSNMTSGVRKLSATFIEGSFSTTASHYVNYAGGPGNQPPTLTISSATYIVGMGFRVIGSATDDNQVTKIRVNTLYGNATRHLPNTSWTIDVPVVPTSLGYHVVEIIADDGFFTVVETRVVNVSAEPITIFDQTVSMSPAGVYVLPYQIALPARLFTATARVTCSPCTINGTAAVVTGVIDADGYALGCGRYALLDANCSFSTLQGSGQATFLWSQASGGTRLTISGMRV